MKKIIIIAGIVCLAFAACKKDQPTVDVSATYPVSGEWWVQYFLGGTDESGYVKLLTYNTSSNRADSLWVDDNSDFWQEKIKIRSFVDIKNKTFSIKDAVNINDARANPTKVTLVDGKVLLGMAKTPGGNKSDSIYVRFIYSDDATDTFVCAGYRRTGFVEDDH